MKSIVKVLGMGTGLAVLVGGLSTTAQAAPIAPNVYISPIAQTINLSYPGAEATVGVYVEGAAVPLGGFDLDLTWNPNVLDLVGTFGTIPGDEFNTELFNNYFFDTSFDDLSFDQADGTVHLFVSGDPDGNNDGSHSPLLLFYAKFIASPEVHGGVSNLDLLNVTLSDDAQPDANDIIPTTEGGVICTARLGSGGENDPPAVFEDETCQRSVPEPAMMSLLGVGLATLAARRRASKRR